MPSLIAWQHATHTFNIPIHPSLELIEGMRMDLSQNRYATFEDLRLYCYRVASTVGLMASHVIGFSEPDALDHAIDLGVAMQLTNILRDVGEDARNGRIYIPLDEMAHFGYTEEELLRGEINERFVQLMQFQIQRARHLYERAQPGIEYLEKDSRTAIATAAHLYSRILDVIERNGYDVFNRRAYVPFREKLTGFYRVWRQRKVKK
jgi:phytoene synthase